MPQLAWNSFDFKDHYPFNSSCGTSQRRAILSSTPTCHVVQYLAYTFHVQYAGMGKNLI